MKKSDETDVLALIVLFALGAVVYAGYLILRLLWYVILYVIFPLLVIVVSLIAGYFILLGIVWLMEVTLNSRIFIVCPRCRQHLKRLYYKCPNCDRLYKNLYPSYRHIFRIHCACGYTLSTLRLFGKNNYEAFCPICKYVLGTQVGEKQIVAIPIFGGSSAGKTTFLMSSIQILVTNIASEYNWTFSFPYEENINNMKKMTYLFQNGITPDEANEKFSGTFYIDFHRQGTVKDKRVCLCDTSSELFVTDHNLPEKREYLHYMSGLIFIVDPFALRGVKKNRQFLKESNIENLPVCTEDQDQCLNRLLLAFEKTGLIHPASQNVLNIEKKFPCAVVITKSDILDLKEYEKAVEELPPYFFTKTPSDLCRQWLCDQGEDNLVNMLEAEFSECRYFFVSSLGKRTSETTGRFQPWGIEEPYRWLLKVTCDEQA